LYGTTFFGGANEAGTIFRIAKNGTGFTMLHEFSGPDGGGPSGLLLDTSGGSDLFYGVTSTDSRGTIFTITPAGVFTLLASFGPDPDGASPVGPLVKGPDGLFYGVTGRGGPGLLGVLFSVDAGGTITTLHDFGTSTLGDFVRTPLMRSSSGLLYGMTARGAGHGVGALFSVDTAAPDQVVKVIDMPPPGPASPRIG
jgi:uncharacterized repeat protein (TIGR03803 family)